MLRSSGSVAAGLDPPAVPVAGTDDNGDGDDDDDSSVGGGDGVAVAAQDDVPDADGGDGVGISVGNYDPVGVCACATCIGGLADDDQFSVRTV